MLDSLEVNLKRLRIEYEQFFLGQMKREPQNLRGKVQKTITKLLNEPPRNSRQKFRFNTLNSRFQVYRQLWGRTMREMELGTYRRDQFKAKIRSAAPAESPQEAAAKPKASDKPPTSIDQLHKAINAACKKTGEASAMISKPDLDRMVRKQIETIRAKHGDVKVKFRVVIENDKAKLKASVAKKK